MTATVVISDALDWRAIAAIAGGASVRLSDGARQRIDNAAAIVQALVANGTKGYGINTGVGALCDVIIARPQQQALSHNILFSHACGVGSPLPREQTRAIMAAQINNFAHGVSGVRIEIVDALVALLNIDCIPVVPERGSVGYLTHAAAIGLVLIGHGHAMLDGRRISGADACAAIGITPFRLEAKEGLSLVNGTICSTGLACVALSQLSVLLDQADLAGAMSAENLGCQMGGFAAMPLALRKSAGLQVVGARLRDLLADSPMIAAAAGNRTQDPLSIRAIPHIHGAARDMFDFVAGQVNDELASVTDNPAVMGSPKQPEVHSQAHAVGAQLGLSLDALAVAAAEIAATSERRIDRLVNPLVSGLPAFLADGSGVCSGYMIAQYSAAALVSENRRLASPASLDGGITSALQEDALCHPTAAAVKLLAIIDNTRTIVAIEMLAATQAHDLRAKTADAGVKTAAIYRQIRQSIPFYQDDRPMQDDFAAMRDLMQGNVLNPEALMNEPC